MPVLDKGDRTFHTYYFTFGYIRIQYIISIERDLPVLDTFTNGKVYPPLFLGFIYSQEERAIVGNLSVEIPLRWKI